MRFVAYEAGTSGAGLALRRGKDLVALDLTGMPQDLLGLLNAGPDALEAAAAKADRGKLLDEGKINYLPPLAQPPKIICVGLNYADHTKESPYEQPKYPTVFSRFASSLIGHRAPVIRPSCSIELDYEGELVAVIGRKGRNISRDAALSHVVGYSLFNDVSVRDYQFKSPQWTVGKNFDATGPFGPEFITADELPEGAVGLKIETRLNGKTVQSSTTAEMLYPVADIITILSEAMTLEVGDVIVTGTPAGVGFARKPPLFMKHGDTVEVEVEGVGILSNPVQDQ
jgi:acylpyruvate hydrolase